ncbi:hypothetical protein BUALT_Bualt14G0048500 [Buddleja alternifolia]|uniref:EF-hand domain-containing protein n=1 Tax=Buddleja alternifolia TaxID=168488 RepID=A0AAV6WS69_9LAMI|nr:hypothetical protein BUALT_Bualt14G0048500 [Buddleja alternifolia]
MDRLRAIADASYKAAPPGVKTLAHNFFKALDTDQDGRVSLPEYLLFMTQQGYTRFNNPRFFHDLDRDGNGSLDFQDVLTLHYIVKSGRPLCDCCGVLIPGTFFSCVECFDSPTTTRTMGPYSVCIFCLRSNKSDHNHGGHQQFLDTYTLLETKRRRQASLVGGGRSANLNEILGFAIRNDNYSGYSEYLVSVRRI